MLYQTKRYDQAVVFQIDKIFSIEKVKEILAQIEKATDEWVGPAVCMPIFKINIGTKNPLEIEGFINNQSKLIAYDAIDAADLMLVADIDAILHKYRYAPGEKLKRNTTKKKKEVIGPLTKKGFDLGYIQQKFHFFYDPPMHQEGMKLMHLMAGFPFDDWSPADNSAWFEREVILPLRSEFPNIYQLNRLQENRVVECLKIMQDTRLYPHLDKREFNIFTCFLEHNHYNMIISFTSVLKMLHHLAIKGDFEKLKEIRKNHSSSHRTDFEDDDMPDPIFKRLSESVGSTYDTAGHVEEPYDPD